MANENRISGTIKFKADGQTYAASGSFKYNLGTPKREAVISMDGSVPGYKETPTVPFIEGAIFNNKELDVAVFTNLDDVTINLDLSNGKSVILRNAWFAGSGDADTEAATLEVRFEGKEAMEVK